jgi:hypothetical protein
LRGIQRLLHAEGYTIKGVQKILREQGIDQVKGHGEAAIAEAKTPKAAAKAPAKLSARVRSLPTVAKAPAAASRVTSISIDRKAIEVALRELEACRKLLLAPAVKASKAATEDTRRPKAARAQR